MTSPLVYPIVISESLYAMQDRIVESVFEEDLFSWWNDAFNSNEVRSKRAKELVEYRNDILKNFGTNVMGIVTALYSFEFRDVGDVLGELYQDYFDRETRKALGEFYTPTSVVEYILDSIGYTGIINERLLDPACGSGTFIVDALKRYLSRAESLTVDRGTIYYRNWEAILDELCIRPKIVGFDINPFAVLMSQIRFMIELIPYYKKAIEIDPNFTLKTLPIFMTDSLWSEKEEIEQQGQQEKITRFISQSLGDIQFTLELPVEKGDEKRKFVELKFRIPTQNKLGLMNAEQHFSALRILFSLIKRETKKENYQTSNSFKEDFIREIRSIEMVPDAEKVSMQLRPYADLILDEIRVLKERYDDGRLIKSIEDRVLAGILKNFVSFDYVVGNPPWVSKKTKKIFLPD
jgi:hypothetical protein